MNLIDICKRVRKYGLSGVLLWARIKRDNWQAKRFYQRNAAKYPLTPEKGVTIVADVVGKGSLAKVMRDLALNIHEAGLPLQVLCPGAENDPSESGVMSLLVKKEDFRINKYSMVIDMFNGLEVPDGAAYRHATVAFWEFDDGFRQVYPGFAAKKQVIGMSDFVVEVLRRELPDSVKVSKVLYPFRPLQGELLPRMEIRRKFGIPESAFAVFFNFDLGSGFGRKNPDGAIRAFAKAFAADRNAVLVFKTMRAKAYPERVAALERLAEEVGIRDRFIMVHAFVSNEELYGLTNACDVYLSLHRGEGFGLGIAEAMSMGVPVVVSDYSSTTEFCKADNAVLVPCKLVPTPKNPDHLTYTYVTKWAEPDVDAAAVGLRRLRDDVAYRQQLGNTAKAFIADYFSIANFRKSIEALIEE